MAGRGAFLNLVTPGLKTVFFTQLKIAKTMFQQYINLGASKRAFEDDYKIAGPGQMIQKAEGAVYTFDEPIGGDTVRYSHITYGLGFRVTEEMLEDDLYGVMNRMSRELAKAAQYNKDVLGASILNNAFDTNYTGYDSSALCVSDHTPLGGGSDQSNVGAVDLSLPALQAAIEAFEGWLDDRGYHIDIEPETLIHNTGDIWEAGEILESEFIPTSADNAKNIVRSKYGIKPMYLKFLTDTDAWFVVGRKGDHDMKMYIRKDNQFRNSEDPFNGDGIYTARQRISKGFSDWRGVYGSPGA